MLLSANGWFKDEIIQTIEKLGYYVNVDVLNAADFGVPQSRERAIFICSKQMPISLPKPTVSKRTTVRDAIEDLAYLNSGEGAYEQEYISFLGRQFSNQPFINDEKFCLTVSVDYLSVSAVLFGE